MNSNIHLPHSIRDVRDICTPDFINVRVRLTWASQRLGSWLGWCWDQRREASVVLYILTSVKDRLFYSGQWNLLWNISVLSTSSHQPQLPSKSLQAPRHTISSLHPQQQHLPSLPPPPLPSSPIRSLPSHMPSQLFATKFFEFIYLVLEVIMSNLKLLNNTIMVTADRFHWRESRT